MRSYLQLKETSRRAVIGLLFVPGFALWSTAGTAQTVSLDNVTPIALTTSTTQSAISINPSNGNVVIRTANGTYNQCSFPPPVTPTITNFSPTASPVSPSASITLNWNSQNTTSCTPSQGAGTTWPNQGTLQPNGSVSFSAPASATTVTFQLNCFDNNGQSTNATTQVVVQSGGGGGTCTPIYPNGTTSSWATVFNTWPSFGALRRLQVPANGYLAFSFTATATVGQFGTVAAGDFPGDGDGWGQMSISRDPGCFTPANLAPGCIQPAARLPGIGWVNGSSSFSCALTPGQTYWVNFTYGNSTTSGNGPYCPAGPGGCAADVQNQIQD